MPPHCLAVNTGGGTLTGHASNNEYAYRVQTQDPMTVTGFEIFTQTTTGSQETVNASLYLAAPSGAPEDQPAVTGTMTVQPQAGFYYLWIPPELP